MQCFYGEDETDTMCPEVTKLAMTVVRTKGGHHFGGDYQVPGTRHPQRLAAPAHGRIAFVRHRHRLHPGAEKKPRQHGATPQPRCQPMNRRTV